MTLSPRERLISNLLLVGAALLILDRMLLDSYLVKRQDLIQQRDNILRGIDDAKLTLAREKHLRELLAQMGPSLAADSSTVERQFLHKVHDWEQHAGLSNASFQRIAAQNKRGFTQLTFQISASGTLWGVVGLLYSIESSPLPLRLETVQLTPHGSTGDDLQLHLSVSTPCNGMPSGATPTQLVFGGHAPINSAPEAISARSGG